MAKILLTEDDESVRSFVGRALQIDGHTVVTADDGEEGYDRLIEHEGDFDLLLTDIKMPFMDGIELSRTAASTFPNLKILMMTGYADQRERADGLEKIVIDVVVKPFTLEQIRSAVRTALNETKPNSIGQTSGEVVQADDYRSADRSNSRFSEVLDAAS